MKSQIPPKFIPCGSYLPDQPEYRNPGTNTAENVIPRTKTTFGAMPSFARVSTVPLAGAPLGAFASHDSAGNPGMYVGTSAKLYRGTSATQPNFADASAVGGYAVPSGDHWSFTEMSGVAYATNGHDAIQSTQIASTNAFAPLADANAPKGRVLAAIQPGFLLVGDIVDVTVGTKRQGIRWSALGDATSWPLIGTTAATSAESDWQDITGPHGNLKAIAPDLSSCNAAIFFEQAVFRMVYTGDDRIFDIQPVEKLRGTPAPRSVVQVGQIAYFLSWDGWHAFDGTQSTPIGTDRVNQSFFADCDPNYFGNVVGVADTLSGICYWAYPGTGNNNGVPNRVLVYNPFVGRWSLITGFSGTNPFLGRSFGTSLDQIDALGYTLDTLPVSLDDPLLAGGQIRLAAFDAGNYFGTFTGPNMACTVDTSEFQLFAGRRAQISAVRPIVQGDSCSVQVASRQTLQDAVTFSAAGSPNNTGIVSTRCDGMYQRIRLTAPTGHTLKHIQGAEVSFRPSGKR